MNAYETLNVNPVTLNVSRTARVANLGAVLQLRRNVRCLGEAVRDLPLEGGEEVHGPRGSVCVAEEHQLAAAGSC